MGRLEGWDVKMATRPKSSELQVRSVIQNSMFSCSITTKLSESETGKSITKIILCERVNVKNVYSKVGGGEGGGEVGGGGGACV